jgi:hypothetical protein
MEKIPNHNKKDNNLLLRRLKKLKHPPVMDAGERPQIRHEHAAVLLLGEATLVDAVVDGIVDQLVGLVDGGPEVGRVEVQPGVPGDVVELGVEHPDVLGALVVHHRLQLLVPQHLKCNGTLESTRLLGCSALLRAGKEEGESDPLLVWWIWSDGIGGSRGRLASRHSWSWRSRRAPSRFGRR